MAKSQLVQHLPKFPYPNSQKSGSIQHVLRFPSSPVHPRNRRPTDAHLPGVGWKDIGALPEYRRSLKHNSQRSSRLGQGKGTKRGSGVGSGTVMVEGETQDVERSKTWEEQEK